MVRYNILNVAQENFKVWSRILQIDPEWISKSKSGVYIGMIFILIKLKNLTPQHQKKFQTDKRISHVKLAPG